LRVRRVDRQNGLQQWRGLSWYHRLILAKMHSRLGALPGSITGVCPWILNNENLRQVASPSPCRIRRLGSYGFLETPCKLRYWPNSADTHNDSEQRAISLQQLQFVFTACLTRLINALNGRCNVCSAVLCALNHEETWENLGEPRRTGRYSWQIRWKLQCQHAYWPVSLYYCTSRARLAAGDDRDNSKWWLNDLCSNVQFTFYFSI